MRFVDEHDMTEYSIGKLCDRACDNLPIDLEKRLIEKNGRCYSCYTDLCNKSNLPKINSNLLIIVIFVFIAFSSCKCKCI